MNQTDILQKLNLSPSEARTYLAVLQAGKIKVADIAKLIGTTRMAGYLAVNALKDKGLLAETQENGVKLVTAEDPDRLLIRLNEDELALKRQKMSLEELVPELRQMFQSASVKPSVRVYQGIEGMKTVYEDTLKTMKKGDDYVAFGSVDEAWSVLGSYLDDYVARRIAKHISFRGIAPSKEQTTNIKNEKDKLREVIEIPANRFPFRNEIDIYKDKVAILSFRDQLGLIIQSEQVADTQRAIFELSWLGAKGLHERNK